MHTASRVTQISVLALGIAGALAVGQAHASGFQLRENSVKNLGRANSGTAVADDSVLDVYGEAIDEYDASSPIAAAR